MMMQQQPPISDVFHNCVNDLKNLLNEGRIRLTKVSKRHITASMKKFNPQANCTDNEVYVIAAGFHNEMKPVVSSRCNFCPSTDSLLMMFPKFAYGGELSKGIEPELDSLLNFYNELVVAVSIFSPTLDLIVGMLTFCLEARFRVYINGSGATLPTRRRIEMFRHFVPMREKRSDLSVTTGPSFGPSSSSNTPYPSPMDRFPLRDSQLDPYDEADEEDVLLDLDYGQPLAPEPQYDQAMIAPQGQFMNPFKTMPPQQPMQMSEFALQYYHSGVSAENDLKGHDQQSQYMLAIPNGQVTQCEPVVHVETHGQVRTTRLTFTFTTTLAEQPQPQVDMQQQYMGNQAYYYGGTYPYGYPHQPQQMYPQQQAGYQQMGYQEQQMDQVILDSLVEGWSINSD